MMFSDEVKWKRARHLINVVLPEELAATIKIPQEVHDGIQEKNAMPAAMATSYEEAERLAVWKRIDLQAGCYKAIWQ